MKLVANIEIAIQIVHKRGLFYVQVIDTESLNLIFEEECLTREGANNRAGTFVAEALSKIGT